MIRPWDMIERKMAYTCRIFEVHNNHVRSPRTGNVHQVQSIRTPDWIMVLPITADQNVVMVRQYRHGIEDVCLELPGGLVDPADASPLEGARRELIEETGYDVEALEQIGRCYPQPALLANECLFFLGLRAAPVRPQALDAGEDVEIVVVPLTAIPAMIADGRIAHGMVLLAFAYYALGPGKGQAPWG